MRSNFSPTSEQKKFIDHDDSAFVTACPGAGKTQAIVELARRLHRDAKDLRGICFISFTNSALSELRNRLNSNHLSSVTKFPNFIDTFDSFIFRFIVSVFGIPGSDKTPQIDPQMSEREVIPFPTARPLSLEIFDRETGKLIPGLGVRHGVTETNPNLRSYERAALTTFQTLQSQGIVDFVGVRQITSQVIEEVKKSGKIRDALAGRFKAIIIDEAQDCNIEDIAVLKWLKGAGVPVKVVCDPEQGIYGFRGGVSDELDQLQGLFLHQDRMDFTGNFRSTENICRAMTAFRNPALSPQPHEALGAAKNLDIPVHIISYSGRGVNPGIGKAYTNLLAKYDISIGRSPLLASNIKSAYRAVDILAPPSETTTIKLARQVFKFYNPQAPNDRLNSLHKLYMLEQEIINPDTYQSQLIASEKFNDLCDPRERIQALETMKALKYSAGEGAANWLQRTQKYLKAKLIRADRTIKQLLPNSQGLEFILDQASGGRPEARTIHSTKGFEFPAICLVLTNPGVGKILQFLTGEHSDEGIAEEARKLYVAVSRAQRLLVIASPQSKTRYLKELVQKQTANIHVTDL